MPSKSVAQQHLMQAAEHGADFPMAKKLRQSMSHDQLHDFAVGSEQGKPEHVGKMSDPPPPGPTQVPMAPQAPLAPPFARPALIGGNHIAENVRSFKARGQNELDATRSAIKTSRHSNLGKYLHPRKDGKPHGSEL